MALEKNYLKRLKNLSFHKILFFLTLLFLLGLRIFLFSPKENSLQNKIEGKIRNIKMDGNQVSILLMAKEKVLIYYYMKEKEEIEIFKRFQLGDILEAEGDLTHPHSSSNFYLYDNQKDLKSQKIFWILQADAILLKQKNKNVLYKIKNNIIKYLERIDTTGYLKAFILGQKEGINEEAKENYSKLGISHLFAISGMHISFFTTLLSHVFKHPFFIVLFLVFYLFLTDFSISVLRAMFFFLFFTIKKKYSLKITNMEFFFTLCFLFLLYNPYYIYSLSFQFSFIISGVLLWLMPKWEGKKKSSAIFLSFLSFFASIPILANTFFEINILSPVYNIFYIPFVTVFLFPFGILTVFLPFLEPIFAFTLFLFEKITSIWRKIPSYFILKKIPFWALVLFFLMILFCLYKVAKKRYPYIFVLFFLLFLYPYFPTITRYSFVSMINVGQGDAILLHLKSGENILIDTGGILSFKEEWQKKKKETSIAKDTVIPYLKAFGIKKLDYFIISHGDYDHMGEAIPLINNFKVENILFNNDLYNQLETEFINVLDSKKIKYDKGLKELNMSGNKLYFLNTGIYDNENDNSNILYFKLNNYKFLFMGDAGTKREKDIVDKYHLEDIDFIKIGHHGSNTSSSKYFIDHIKPKNCLISVGKNNRYGHPKKSVLDTLEEYCTIYRTDLNGSIEIKLDKKNYKIKTNTP